jgi:hypothetical protein
LQNLVIICGDPVKILRISHKISHSNGLNHFEKCDYSRKCPNCPTLPMQLQSTHYAIYRTGTHTRKSKSCEIIA